MYMSPVINLLNFLKYHVKTLGDADYQERVWVRHEGPEVFDYDEATMYFGSGCEKIFEHPEMHEGVDEVVYNALRILYDKYTHFDDEIADHIPDHHVAELIRRPEWREIQQLATETYERLTKHLKEKGYEP